MPIYEYQCNDCEHRLEAIQKISDDPLTECPQCGEGSLRKLISAASFRLKGTGWYETDFKNKPSKKKAKPAEVDKKSGSSGKSNDTSTSSSSKAANSS